MRKRTNARECAIKILYQIDITGEECESALKTFWQNHPVEKSIKTFAVSLVRGTIKYKEDIDRLIAKHAINWDIRRMAIIDRNVLRLSIYELLHLHDIPPKVTINEAVDISKKYSSSDAGKFVNGILDNIRKSEC